MKMSLISINYNEFRDKRRMYKVNIS